MLFKPYKEYKITPEGEYLSESNKKFTKEQVYAIPGKKVIEKNQIGEEVLIIQIGTI